MWVAFNQAPEILHQHFKLTSNDANNFKWPWNHVSDLFGERKLVRASKLPYDLVLISASAEVPNTFPSRTCTSIARCALVQTHEPNLSVVGQRIKPDEQYERPQVLDLRGRLALTQPTNSLPPASPSSSELSLHASG